MNNVYVRCASDNQIKEEIKMLKEKIKKNEEELYKLDGSARVFISNTIEEDKIRVTKLEIELQERNALWIAFWIFLLGIVVCIILFFILFLITSYFQSRYL